jgi:hypothetical protein
VQLMFLSRGLVHARKRGSVPTLRGTGRVYGHLGLYLTVRGFAVGIQ